MKSSSCTTCRDSVMCMERRIGRFNKRPLYWAALFLEATSISGGARTIASYSI